VLVEWLKSIPSEVCRCSNSINLTITLTRFHRAQWSILFLSELTIESCPDLTTVDEGLITDEGLEEPARTATTPPPVFLAGSESPGVRSNMSMSGTTAISNLSETEAAELDGENMLFMLRSLYAAAQVIFGVVIPHKAQDPKLAEIVRDIKIPGSSASKRLNLSEQSFRLAQTSFKVDGDYISTQAVMKSIFGGRLPEADAKGWAATEIIQTANLASFATWVASAEQDSIKTWNILRSIDNAFPTWFLTSLLEPQTRLSSSSSAPSWKIGSSTLLEQTFSFALELRTQVAVLALLRQQEQESFDPEQAIRDVFFDPEDDDQSEMEEVRVWSINGLGGDNELHPKFIQKLQERILAIRQCFHEESQALLEGDFTGLQQLQASFPWSKFTIDALKWTRRRQRELLVFVENRGGVDGIVSSIKQEINVEDSMIGLTTTPEAGVNAQTTIEQRGTPRANGKQKTTSHNRSGHHIHFA
jgi:hypothetical protein